MYQEKEEAMDDKEFENIFANYMIARKAIIDYIQLKKLPQNCYGKFPCPICDGEGDLSFSRASNGHIHAKCSTPKCTAWME